MSARKKISMKICRCLSSSGTTARLKLARRLPHRDVKSCFFCWWFCSIICNAAMSLWSFHHNVIGACLEISVLRAYIQRIKDSQTGKPHCQESSLQKNTLCLAATCATLCKLLWPFVFVVIRGIICARFQVPGWPTVPCLQSLEEDEGNKRLDMTFMQLGISQNGGTKHSVVIVWLVWAWTLSLAWTCTALWFLSCQSPVFVAKFVFHDAVPNFCLRSSFKIPNCSASGMDATKSGTRTSASGSVTSKTAKSAVKSALDSAVATMQTPAGLDDVDDKSKGAGAGNKRARQGNAPKPAKEKTQHEKDLKKIQKDIKSFFDQNSIYCFPSTPLFLFVFEHPERRLEAV